jgi:hypothetical protein
VSIPPHKFVRPPCWYYLLKEIENYDFRVFPNGITSIPDFIQVRPDVFLLNHTETDRHDRLSAFISCTSCNERIIIVNTIWIHLECGSKY